MICNIGIIDVGGCNLGSIIAAIEKVGLKTSLISSSKDIIGNKVDALCLPGSGNSSHLAQRLRERNLFHAIQKKSYGGFPVLGICSGMQVMFDVLEEPICKHQDHQEINVGLALFEGKVTKIFDGNKALNIGWRSPFTNGASKAIIGQTLGSSSQFFFMHGFGVICDEKHKDADHITLGNNEKIIAMKRVRSTIGVQFHPERSGEDGLLFLKNLITYLEKKRKET